jgi:hypothetical protein
MINLKWVVVSFGAFFALVWVPLLLIQPVFEYSKGTSENVTVELLSAPYVDSDNLKYRWRGDIVRNCPITIRREIIDAKGYIRTLVPTSVPALPDHELGPTYFDVSVETPYDLPEGVTIYRATEYPSCSLLQIFFPVGIPYPEVMFVVDR